MRVSRYLSIPLALLLASCSGPTVKDGPPPRDVDVSSIPDAVPRIEPITAAGNKSPYVVLGKQYVVMPTSSGYRERGKASWYGTKFHGNRTSNGEVYDMYTMTAAHKTLPIPSYVQVTNLANGRKVIVRVNDRGPFHAGRIIDLSYVAAKKLGISETGTADVEVVAIDPARFQRNTVESPRIDQGSPAPSAGPLPGNTYLQAGAFGSMDAAEESRQRISKRTGYPVIVRKGESRGKTLFKVLVGPIGDHASLTELRTLLVRTENLSPFVVYP